MRWCIWHIRGCRTNRVSPRQDRGVPGERGRGGEGARRGGGPGQAWAGGCRLLGGGHAGGRRFGCASGTSEAVARIGGWLGKIGVFRENRGVAVNVRCGDVDQGMLLPPSVRGWLPEDHLAFF